MDIIIDTEGGRYPVGLVASIYAILVYHPLSDSEHQGQIWSRQEEAKKSGMGIHGGNFGDGTQGGGVALLMTENRQINNLDAEVRYMGKTLYGK